MRADIDTFVTTCDICQRFKRQKKHYGHLPAKSVELEPWAYVSVDLVGPYTVTSANRVVDLHALSIIDIATQWVEIVPLNADKGSETIALLFDRVWLCRYPRPLDHP